MYIGQMRIIAKSKLRAYWIQKKYESAQPSLSAWHDEVKQAQWHNFNELRAAFPKASVVGNGRVVFNILGGDFRLIVKVEFPMNAVFIRFFGTHQEYDLINASEV
jgi:mRNA interferase HigB